MKGLAFDELVQTQKENYEKLKSFNDKFEKNKRRRNFKNSSFYNIYKKTINFLTNYLLIE